MIIPGSVIVVIRLLIKLLLPKSLTGMENNIVQKASRKCLSQNRECMMVRKIPFSENVIVARLKRKIAMRI